MTKRPHATRTRNVVVVGASDRNIPWTSNLVTNLTAYGLRGEIWLVNPRREQVAGRTCHRSIADLPGRPDIGVVLLNAARVAGACRDLVAAGCADVVVVSNGFRETRTDEGTGYELALRRAFAGSGSRLFGPNCVGFAEFHDGVCAIAQPMPVRVAPGPVSLVSQSGGLTAATLGAVTAVGLGVDACYSIGNGTAFGLADALRQVLARDTTRVVCAVVESIDEPAAVAEAAARARATGKYLAFLVLGRSEESRRVAQSHTGAVVGEHRMVTAWLRRCGIPVAASPDELGHLAMLLLRGRLDRRGRPAIATVSGGGATITGDLAARHGVPLATLAEETVAALRDLLPPGSHIGNPLDVSNGDAPAAYAALAADPRVSTLIEPWTLAWPDGSAQSAYWRAALDRVTGAGRDAGRSVIVGSLFPQPLNDWVRAYAARHGIVISPDLDRTMAALGALYATATTPATTTTTPTTDPPAAAEEGAPDQAQALTGAPSSGAVAGSAVEHPPGEARMITEAEGREILSGLGLPVVAGRRCTRVDEVVRAARELSGPLVLKLDAPQIGHRDRVGGVRLGLTGEAALREAAAAIRDRAVAAGVAPEEIGFLVEEMVFGPELLVGAVRDPIAGPTVTVAVGGWAAEAGALFGTLVLPVSAAQVSAAVADWRLPHLLGEWRAGQLAGLLAAVAGEFATGALSGYRTVELNPVILGAGGPRIADVLMLA